MIPERETFGGTWPFAPRCFEGNGFRMHYVDEGLGEPIICLHGEPTWGYLYRRFIPPLSKANRVVVPDHMGFGKSETPRDREYLLKTHVENLARLIDELDLKNITFVIQDWGGPIGAAYALRHPDRVKRLFLLNTLTGYGRAKPSGLTPWFQFIKKHHDAGTLHAVLGRIVPFVKEGFPLLENLKSKPAMLAVGMKDRGIAPDVQIADFRGIWPGRPVVELPDAGHFSQEDVPDTIVALIQLFMQST